MDYVIELVAAWASWWQIAPSALPADFVLWGRPLHWWGRVGIATQLISGLALLVASRQVV